MSEEYQVKVGEQSSSVEGEKAESAVVTQEVTMKTISERRKTDKTYDEHITAAENRAILLYSAHKQAEDVVIDLIGFGLSKQEAVVLAQELATIYAVDSYESEQTCRDARVINAIIILIITIILALIFGRFFISAVT